MSDKIKEVKEEELENVVGGGKGGKPGASIGGGDPYDSSEALATDFSCAGCEIAVGAINVKMAVKSDQAQDTASSLII